jgi:hypothetical protein
VLTGASTVGELDDVAAAASKTLVTVSGAGQLVAAVPVPRLWSDSTIAIIAAGPSLTAEDCDYVRGRVDATIAVNMAYKLAPWADVLYGCDGGKFWKWQKGVPSFHGLKYSLTRNAYKIPQLRNAGDEGLSLDPSAVCTGQNSAFQSVNLARHFGARRIILLGVDMKRGPKGQKHFHGADHQDGSQPPYRLCLRLWDTIVQPLQTQGIEVINCSPSTALHSFPCRPLREVLP